MKDVRYVFAISWRVVEIGLLCVLTGIRYGLKKVEGRKIRFQRYNYTLIFNLPYRWDAK